jgi:hypothetical protein
MVEFGDERFDFVVDEDDGALWGLEDRRAPEEACPSE